MFDSCSGACLRSTSSCSTRHIASLWYLGEIARSVNFNIPQMSYSLKWFCLSSNGSISLLCFLIFWGFASLGFKYQDRQCSENTHHPVCFPNPYSGLSPLDSFCRPLLSSVSRALSLLPKGLTRKSKHKYGHAALLTRYQACYPRPSLSARTPNRRRGKYHSFAP